ncbi:MAG: DUF6062 family protein [Anaerolineae bacterium]
MPMNESTRHVDLLKAFDAPRCPVCNLVMRDLKHDLDMLLLERINKVPTHLAFRAGRGLCNAHAHQLMQARGGAPAIAIMYESTMVEFVKDLAKSDANGGFGQLIGRQGKGERVADQLEPAGNCLMCDQMNKNETAFVSIIAENVSDPDLIDAYEHSIGGVCLPHARMVLRQLKRPDQIRAFRALQAPKWYALHADLKLYIKHNDENVPHHKMGPEGNSWSRAIRYLSGEADVFGYRR